MGHAAIRTSEFRLTAPVKGGLKQQFSEAIYEVRHIGDG